MQGWRLYTGVLSYQSKVVSLGDDATRYCQTSGCKGNLLAAGYVCLHIGLVSNLHISVVQQLAMMHAGQKLRCVGSALSPNGLAFSTDGMLSLALLDQVLDIDVEKAQVTVQAGARVQEVTLFEQTKLVTRINS